MKTFYLTLLVLILFLMQSIAADRISFGEIAPDFIILVILFFALHRGAVKGALFGFVIGFVQDLGNPTFLGLNALLKSITGYLMGRAGQKMIPENVILLFIRDDIQHCAAFRGVYGNNRGCCQPDHSSVRRSGGELAWQRGTVEALPRDVRGSKCCLYSSVCLCSYSSCASSIFR